MTMNIALGPREITYKKAEKKTDMVSVFTYFSG